MVEAVFYRYPPRTLVGDYVRAALGTAFCLLVLLANPFDPWLAAIFGALALAFAAFGLRTLRHHLTRVAVSPDGVFVKDVGTRGLPWPGLQQVKLRFYGTRRQTQGGQITGGGFLQLTLRGQDIDGAGRKLVFDSHLVGFKDVAWHAARAARQNEVDLDPTTAGNLLDIGVDADGESPRPQPEERMTL